uniref:Uncharacterized protein n=1 Tax=Glossina austeni TaxID=7395 RepID=A0A1A9V0M7_GLOAU
MYRLFQDCDIEFARPRFDPSSKHSAERSSTDLAYRDAWIRSLKSHWKCRMHCDEVNINSGRRSAQYFHEELGMDDLDSLASLLNGAEEEMNGESTFIAAEAATSNGNEGDTEYAYNIDDEMLNIPENENMELSNLLNRSYDDLYAT